MTKEYIKLNDNDNHLSIGNLFRIIKDMAKNKNAAMQNELFCTMFEVDKINDTTVNNYCVGCRSIGDDYKQIYLNKVRKYEKDVNVFLDIVCNLISIIDGVVWLDISKNSINKSETAFLLATKLYNLAKNDDSVNKDVTDGLGKLLKDKDVYTCLVKELVYIVLEKKQPLYVGDVKKNIFENILSDTSMSALDLQNYLSLKLKEGINYDYSLKVLAKDGNALANFELGSNEYYGYFAGYPRYDQALSYLEKAASLNHASANYMIGNMFINGYIGNKTNKELELGYNYYLKAMELGNIAAINAIGNMYYNGVYPLKKDEEKALELYMKAASYDYVYAHNNIGNIYEKKNDMETAFHYYLISADLGSSWACNKVGEYYRNIDEDEKAFGYYTKALDSNHRTLCYYAYYNLAKYFYYYGTSFVKKDEDLAIKYFDIASLNGVFEASLELFNHYVNKYKNNRTKENLDMVYIYKNRIENHDKYTNDVKNMIEKNLNSIVSDINIECLIK